MSIFLASRRVYAHLVSTVEDARAAAFGSGAAPVFTLIVNGAKHDSVEAFLQAAKASRDAYASAGDAEIVHSGVHVARVSIGQSSDAVLAGWSGLDALLMAGTFDLLAAAIDEAAAPS